MQNCSNRHRKTSTLLKLQVAPTSLIPPPGTPPQSPPCSQSHPRAAPEPRRPPESPAKTHPLAPYIGRISESFLSECLHQRHRVRHQQKFCKVDPAAR